MFGRYTAILSEHRHLGTTLTRLVEMCAMLEMGERTLSPASEPSRLIEETVRELSEHFAAEESDGYFGTIARERPALAVTITDLEAEHASMLATLRDVLVAAGDERCSSLVVSRLRWVIELLRTHERRETEMMQSFMLRGGETGVD
jgi:hypothetical protein